MRAAWSGFEWDLREAFSSCHIYWAQPGSSGKLYKEDLSLHCSSAFHYMLWATTWSVVENVKGTRIPLQAVKISPPSAWVITTSDAFSSLSTQDSFGLLIEIPFWHTSAIQNFCTPFLMFKLFWFMGFCFTSSHLLDSICRFFSHQKHRQWNHWPESALGIRKCKCRTFSHALNHQVKIGPLNWRS